MAVRKDPVGRWPGQLAPGGPAALPAALAVALALAGCATTAPCPTGTISGRVRFDDGPGSATRGVVVMAWPETPPAGHEPLSHGRARVEIDAGRFAPATLLVAAGTSVEFRNRDQVFHIPFSRSPAGAFELGRCAPGDVHVVKFDQAGVIQVYCALHPLESMTVVVTPDGFRARPAADGSFTFRNVPYGTYLVRAWHPAEGELTRRVEVGPRGPALVSLEP